MKKEPVRVSCIGQKGGFYQILFPHLQIPVEVNEELYQKMLHSNQYHFVNAGTKPIDTYSA